jgi:hypothetical protein
MERGLCVFECFYRNILDRKTHMLVWRQYVSYDSVMQPMPRKSRPIKQHVPPFTVSNTFQPPFEGVHITLHFSTFRPPWFSG